VVSDRDETGRAEAGRAGDANSTFGAGVLRKRGDLLVRE
jgi:hypothetical protein